MNKQPETGTVTPKNALQHPVSLLQQGVNDVQRAKRATESHVTTTWGHRRRRRHRRDRDDVP